MTCPPAQISCIHEMNAEEANDHAGRVVTGARRVIENYGARTAGSEGETRTQLAFAEELRAMGFDDVRIEPFRVHPTAFMGFEPVLAGLVCLAVGAWWSGARWVAFALANGGLAIAVLELVLYREFLDPFFPARTSHNVVARLAPASGVVRRRVVVGGHADAAFAWTFNRIHWTFFWAVHVLQIGSAIVIAATTFLPVFGYNDLTMGLVHAVCGALSLTSFFNTRWSCPVPGANDNLSGALGAIAIGRHFVQNRLANSELVVFISGSEEAGLRGAKAFAQTHRAELCTVETVFLELETLRELDSLSVAYKDLNGLVVQDSRVVKLVQRAARSELGHELKMQSVYCGATDAAALAEIGVASVSIAGMSSGPPLYYHTMKDSWDNMSQATIAAALRVAAQAVAIFDNEGLNIELYKIPRPLSASAPSDAAASVAPLTTATTSTADYAVSPAIMDSDTTFIIGTIEDTGLRTDV